MTQKITSENIYGHLAVLKLGQILAYDCTVGHAAKRVFMIFSGYAGKDESSYPSARLIAQRLDMTHSAVLKQLNILVEKGYISKEARYNSVNRARLPSLITFNCDIARMYAACPHITSYEARTTMFNYLLTLLRYGGCEPLEVKGGILLTVT